MRKVKVILSVKQGRNKPLSYLNCNYSLYMMSAMRNVSFDNEIFVHAFYLHVTRSVFH